jgi:hypothetical protein
MSNDRGLACGLRLARALLGVDALYRADSGDADGLVVLNMDSDEAIARENFASYADAVATLADVEAEAASLAEPDRRLYYSQVCRSTMAFIAWRTNGLDFTTRLRDFLHVPAKPVSAAQCGALCGALREALARLGHTGDLATQCAAWEARNRVEPGDAARVLEDWLDRAWDRTEAVFGTMPASRSDGMHVRTVSGVPFNARCDYASRTIELNTDPVLTRPGLKHLAVHEGYPGHYLQFKLRETWHREGTAAADVLLSVVNTASSSVFEGIADAGMHMLAWIDSDDDRVQALLNRHRSAIGTGAAWRLHALNWGRDAVADWLRSQALIGGDGWVVNRMRFLTAPSRAVLIWSYWWGEPVVERAWRGVHESRRPAFFRFLYGRMHSTTSVEMFE